MPCCNNSSAIVVAAFSASHSIRGAARLKSLRGSRPPTCSAFCRIAFASKSTERTPIAFLRNGTELGLIDAHGVILDRPRGEDFQFPIVTGLSDSVSREERGRRMATYQQFLRDIDIVRAGSSDRVSEIDLSNPKDLRAVMTGISSANDSQAVTIQFGAADFGGKYRLVVDNFAQWQASNGHVRNIDLQYSKQVILNTDSSGGTTVAKSR